MSEKSPSITIHKALNDFIVGAKEWRIWHMMAITEIKMRYKRSKFGQLWITLSNAINILALGLIWASVFKIELKDYMPYVTVNFFLWMLLSSIVTDSCSIFTSSTRYMQQIPLKKSSFAYMNVYRNFVIFAHNIIVIVAVFLFFQEPLGINFLFSVAGLVLIALNAIWVSILIGIICARFRDVTNITASMLQIAFYLTPTLWKLQNMSPKIVLISNFNPFNIFISIVRDGLFNLEPNLRYWKSALCITAIGWLVTILVFSKYRNRIVFWV
jgi:ABC-2 type transport system permease protein/lipopolysaccharide transport system permease protein